MFTFLPHLTVSPSSVSHHLWNSSSCICRAIDTCIQIVTAIDALSDHTLPVNSDWIMTDPGALSSWCVAPSKLPPCLMPLSFFPAEAFPPLRNPTQGIFSLNDEAPKPRPRAWERAPKSPVLARHHGRKVWKRYEAPTRAETKDGSRNVNQTRQVLGDATNTPRPVKRLRLKDVPKAENDGKDNKAAQYLTTLRDKENAGTPRRECCRQLGLTEDAWD